MQQEITVSSSLECVIRSGGSEKEGDCKSGGQDKEHERNHVLDYFDDNAEKDAGALEEGEDLEGLHAVEETQQSQEHCLGAVLRGRGSICSHGHCEVNEGKEEAEDVEVVPEVAEVGPTSFVLEFNGLDDECPELNEENRNDNERSAEEGSVEEENEQPSQEEGVVEDKEPERVLPSLLKVELNELGLEDGEVPSLGELLCECESDWVVAWGEFKPTSVDFDLSFLVVASLSELFFEPLLGRFF